MKPWWRPSAKEQSRFSKAVRARDGFICAFCGSIGGQTEADHIIPCCRGGKTELENGRTLCFPCHRRDYKKSHRSDSWWDGTQHESIHAAIIYCPWVDKSKMVR